MDHNNQIYSWLLCVERKEDGAHRGATAYLYSDPMEYETG